MSNNANSFVHRIKISPPSRKKREAGNRRGYIVPSNLVFFILRNLYRQFRLLFQRKNAGSQTYCLYALRRASGTIIFFALIIAYIDENIPSYFVECSNHLSFPTTVTIKFCTSTVNSFLHL